MHSKLFKLTQRVIALTFCVGALPFFFCPRVHAQEEVSSSQLEPEKKDAAFYFAEYKEPVGFTYDVSAKIQTTYLWRGLYAGGADIQAEATVGYGGAYANMWWNVGVTDWTFRHFEPELDISLGFARWGLNIYLLYVHNFNCGFFDFGNYPDRGNRLELNVRWTVSSKLPLSILWATRVAASDGYINAAGDTVRAWSSYLQLSYTHHFPYDISLSGALGITPWRSCYTGYQRDFAVQNVEVRLRKDWSVSAHCGLMLEGQVVINPSAIAADPSSASWKPYDPGNQSINANLAFGVYLK